MKKVTSSAPVSSTARTFTKSRPLRMWETTGGSVLLSEDSLEGAIREVREELGIDLPPKAGRLMFSRVRDWVDGRRFGDILDVWEFPYEGEARLDLAEGEACDTRWADIIEIGRMLESGEMVETLRYIMERKP